MQTSNDSRLHREHYGGSLTLSPSLRCTAFLDKGWLYNQFPKYND